MTPDTGARSGTEAGLPPIPDIRYGIIGTGMMGLEHIWNLQQVPGARIAAIADPEAESRRLVRDFAGLDSSVAEFAGHADLIESGSCDAVVVSTPNMTHAEVMFDVLDSDLHVLVEKPLCTSVADCLLVIDAAAGRDAVVWVGLEYRYMPPVARVAAEVAAGTVGRVRMVAIREHRFPFLAKVRHWNRFNHNTGGTLVEKCCHFFDLMNHLVGERPVRVMASGGQDVNHLDERYDGEQPDIWDNALVILEYPSGCRGMVDLCMFAEASANQEEVSVVGDEGKAEAFLPSSEVRIGVRSEGPPGVRSQIVHDPRVRYEGFHHGSSYLEHLDFAAAVRGGSAPVVELEDGLWSVAIGVAAQRSVTERRPVDLAEVLADH